MVVEKKPFEKIVYPHGFEIYRNHDIIPIEGVAEALGIDVRSNGADGFKIKCPCPDHADNNPSTNLNISGKYENTFKCWSCGEHGGPLELVMAVKSGLSPSKYWDIINSHGEGKYSKREYIEAVQAKKDAAKFIDEFYPGAIKIEYYENGKKVNKEEDEIERPSLPAEIWDELKNWVNISRSVGFQKFITIQNDEFSKPEKIDFGALDDYAYGELMYNKLFEVQSCLKAYKRQILHDFPDLDGKAKMTIIKTIEARVDNIDIHIERFREYMMKVWDRDYPAENIFDKMAEELEQEQNSNKDKEDKE